MQNAKHFSITLQNNYIGRVAKIEDVAPTFVHVIESTYLNGVDIPVNGGAVLQTIE